MFGLSNKSKEKDEQVHGWVVWSVRYDVDDLDGAGWYVSSMKASSGPIRSKSKAVETAFREADYGDVVQIWGKDADEPDLEFVH